MDFRRFAIGVFAVIALFMFVFAFGLTADKQWTWGLVDMVGCAICVGAIVGLWKR
jgi:hypothetical protein